MSPQDLDPKTVRRSVRELFIAFFLIGVSGFGGVLPWARRILVEKRRWMSEDEFTDLLSVCSVIPGPNIVNMSVAYGAAHAGAAGSVAAFGGLMLAPLAVVIALGAVYTGFGHVPQVEAMLKGMSAAGAGMMVAAGLKLAAAPRLRTPLAVFGLAAFALVGLLRLPLVIVLLVLGPLAVFAAARRMR